MLEQIVKVRKVEDLSCQVSKVNKYIKGEFMNLSFPPQFRKKGEEEKPADSAHLGRIDLPCMLKLK